MAPLIINDQCRLPAHTTKTTKTGRSHMSLPSTILRVTAKQLLVLVTVGAAAYLLSNHDETSAQDLAIEAFIRSQERVAEQAGYGE
jgi:hypothetical protein